VRKQLKTQTARQSEQARDELFLKIYDSLSEEIQACQRKLSEVSIKILTCPGRIDSYWMQKNEFGLQKPSPISDRSESLSEISFEFHSALIRVMSIIERYQIIFPNQRLFKAFKSALFMQSRAQADAFDPFWKDVRKFLPTDVPQEEQATFGVAVLEPQQPTKEEIEGIHKLAEAHLDVCTQMTGCLIDLLHEAQNNLLGHLFQRQLPPRIPRKDGIVSVRNDDAILTDIEERARIWEEQFNPDRRKQAPNE
jgi:hypothetical protein